MDWHARLNKPYYFYRPGLAVRRLQARITGSAPTGPQTIGLPWGLTMSVDPDEVVGQRLVRRGVFDLPLTEAVWRLVDPGDFVVDVGANVGYVVGLAALKAGPTGRVLALEPHPVVRKELEANLRRWQNDARLAPIEVRSEAASDTAGTAYLRDEDLETNRGSASLEGVGPQDPTGEEVATARLDDLVPDFDIGLMKVDVEGHEASVFRGMRQVLEARRVRDIIFEETDEGYPTAVTTILADHGYRLFRLGQTLRGVALVDNGQAVPIGAGDELNYLATIDPARAISRLRTRGWRSLRVRN